MSTAQTRRIELTDLVAMELAGEHDRILRALEERLDLDIVLRGNRVTLSGEPARVEAAEAVIAELSALAAAGESLGQAAIESVVGAVETSLPLGPMRDDVVWQNRQRTVTPRTAGQSAYVAAIRENTITFGIGPAGTGKTYLAVAMAVAAFSRREVNRIVLSRPAVEAGERLGFLPGDLSEKVDPYLRPLFDALYDLLDPERVTTLIERGEIEVAPLAFMRGRTLSNSFVILDEAQNATAEQMKMFLTRLGYGSTMVITGDDTQIDLPPQQRSGLVAAPAILAGVPDLAIIRLGAADVVRHRMVKAIVAAYERAATPRGILREPGAGAP